MMQIQDYTNQTQSFHKQNDNFILKNIMLNF